MTDFGVGERHTGILNPLNASCTSWQNGNARHQSSNLGHLSFHERPALVQGLRGGVPSTTINGLPARANPSSYSNNVSPMPKQNYHTGRNTSLTSQVKQPNTDFMGARAQVQTKQAQPSVYRDFNSTSVFNHNTHAHHNPSTSTRSNGAGVFNLNLGSMPPHILQPHQTHTNASTTSARKQIHFAAASGNDSFNRGFIREEYNLVGFGPSGVGGSLIGNQNRRSQTIMIHPDSPSKTKGSIGWGTDKPNCQFEVKHKVLEHQSHKNAYDHGNLKNNLQMETSGFQAQHTDDWLGLPYEELENLSVRQQREIVKKRAKEIFAEDRAQRRMYSMIHTKPIDTATNTKIHFKKIEMNMQRLTYQQLQAIASSDAQLNSVGSGNQLLDLQSTPKNGPTQMTHKPDSSYDDMTNARTTAGGIDYGTDESPLLKNARNRDNSSVGAKMSEKTYGKPNWNTGELQSVMETHSNLPSRLMYETMPHNKRMLAKGCPRLLKMVGKHKDELMETKGFSQSNYSNKNLNKSVASHRKNATSKNWNVFHQKQQAMDALFERYKASFMSNRSGDARNAQMSESQRLMKGGQNAEHPYQEGSMSIGQAQKNTFSGPLNVKNKLHSPLVNNGSNSFGKNSQNLPHIDHNSHQIQGANAYQPGQADSGHQENSAMSQRDDGNEDVNKQGTTRQSVNDSINESGDYTTQVNLTGVKPGHLNSVTSGGGLTAESTTMQKDSVQIASPVANKSQIASIIEDEKNEDDRESQNTEPKVEDQGSDNNKVEGNDA